LVRMAHPTDNLPAHSLEKRGKAVLFLTVPSLDRQGTEGRVI